MTVNRRISEAISLREFFHDQWNILQGLLSKRAVEQKARQAQQQNITHAIEDIVEGTDQRIRGVMRYRDKLRQAAGHCLHHIESTVDALPSAVDASNAALQEQGVARMLVSSKLKLQELLRDDPELYASMKRVDSDASDQLHLLFISGYQERQVLRPDLKGDLLVHDEWKTTASFSGRRVLLPSASELDLRRSLKRYLFEQFIVQIRLDIVKRKQCQASGIDLTDDLNNPENYLALLVELLNTPAQVLHQEEVTLYIDQLGYKSELDKKRGYALQKMRVGQGIAQFMVMLKAPRSELLESG